MKNPILPFLSLVCLAMGNPAEAEESELPNRLPRDQIEILVGPIALYPDALVALILPASTRPSDIVLAARFLERDGDPDSLASQPWEDSVKSLCRYPEVITYLDENLAWTQSLGDCFLLQPVEVMDAIQVVRARARAKGLLADTDEQSVLVEDGEIRIVPARPTVIYVPRYDPDYLYLTETWYPGPFLSFGIGYGIGAWLSYDCDWRYHRVRIVQRAPAWYHQPNWRTRPVYHQGGHHVRDWSASRPAPRYHRSHGTPSSPVLRPTHGWTGPTRTRVDSPDRRRPHDRPPGTNPPPPPPPQNPRPPQNNVSTPPQPRPRINNRENRDPGSRPDHHRPGNWPPGNNRPNVVNNTPTFTAPSLSIPVTPQPTTVYRPPSSNQHTPRTERRNDGVRPAPRERATADAPRVHAPNPPPPRHSEGVDRSGSREERRPSGKPAGRDPNPEIE